MRRWDADAVQLLAPRRLQEQPEQLRRRLPRHQVFLQRAGLRQMTAR